MNRTDLAIHDIALALSSLDSKMQNRQQIFIKSLESLVRFAINEQEMAPIQAVQNDMARVNEILEQSKV